MRRERKKKKLVSSVSLAPQTPPILLPCSLSPFRSLSTLSPSHSPHRFPRTAVRLHARLRPCVPELAFPHPFLRPPNVAHRVRRWMRHLVGLPRPTPREGADAAIAGARAPWAGGVPLEGGLRGAKQPRDVYEDVYDARGTWRGVVRRGPGAARALCPRPSRRGRAEFSREWSPPSPPRLPRPLPLPRSAGGRARPPPARAARGSVGGLQAARRVPRRLPFGSSTNVVVARVRVSVVPRACRVARLACSRRRNGRDAEEPVGRPFGGRGGASSAHDDRPRWQGHCHEDRILAQRQGRGCQEGHAHAHRPDREARLQGTSRAASALSRSRMRNRRTCSPLGRRTIASRAALAAKATAARSRVTRSREARSEVAGEHSEVGGVPDERRRRRER